MTDTRITFDIIETGSTIIACKMLGTVPITHEPDDFNLYVRTVGSTVIVSRSDSDETIVKAVGFGKAMVSLANYYGLTVVVAHELDHGYSRTKKSMELAGTYEPTREDSGYRTLDNGVQVHVGDILAVPSVPGTQPLEIVTLGAGPGDAVVRHMVTGDYERVDNIMWYHGEPLVLVSPGIDDDTCRCERIADSGLSFAERHCPCGAVFPAVERIQTRIGDTWSDVIADVTMSVIGVTDDHIEFRNVGSWRDGIALTPLKLAALVDDGVMVRHAGIGDALYRERDGHTGVVEEILSSGELVVEFTNGEGRHMTEPEFIGDGYEVIPADTMDELMSGADSTSEPLPFRTACKHKSTRKFRARRNG